MMFSFLNIFFFTKKPTIFMFCKQQKQKPQIPAPLYHMEPSRSAAAQRAKHFDTKQVVMCTDHINRPMPFSWQVAFTAGMGERAKTGGMKKIICS